MTTTRKLHFQNYQIDATTYVAEVGSIFFDPTSTTLRIGDGVTPGGNAITGAGSSLPVISVTYSDEGETANDSVGGIPDSGIGYSEAGAADVLYTVTSGTTVTATGVVVTYGAGSTSGSLTAAGAAGTGANGTRFLAGETNEPFVAMVYATNASGTAYSAPASGMSRTLCLAAGTLITLADGSQKYIEDIAYDDALLVWDFDHGRFADSKPLWIMQGQAARAYNALRFSDGSTLRTVGQHRVFNKEAGGFTYPLTDATPLGTATYNQFGGEISLVEKGVVASPTIGYNIITDYHLNLFANGILTSTSFNNMYPIADMRFVKDGRTMRQDAFQAVPDRFYYGMRLWEQTREAAYIERYIRRLMATEVNTLVDA